MNNNKQFLFTNEAMYERNISDRVWPMFLEAQIQKDLGQAHKAVKCYFLFTQQWYQPKSNDILTKLNSIRMPERAATHKTAAENERIRQKAWRDLENIWMQISNQLENYGLFKKNFTINPNKLALPTG